MNRNRWVAVSIVGLGVCGVATRGVVAGRASQVQAAQTPNAPPVVVENRFDRPVPVRVVNALDRPDLEVPIRAVVTALPVVKLDPETTVALKDGTVVKLARPHWEYRELRVPTTAGSAPNVVSALMNAGAEGWETTGLSFSTPGATVIVLKRTR